MRIDSIHASADRFLTGLRQLDKERERAQREVASGLRLESPSDDPDSVSQLLQIRAELSRLRQNGKDLDRLGTEAAAADTALQTAVKLMDRVRTLATQGASSFVTTETRQGLADEVGDILQRLVALSNTQSDGRFIFSGDNDLQPSYAWDAAAVPPAPPWGAFQGTAANRQAEHPTGSRMPVAHDARQIFENPADEKNVFLQVQRVFDSLSNDDLVTLRDAQQKLATTTSHLNSELTFYGNVISRVDEAAESNSQMSLRLESIRASLEEADMAGSIVRVQEMQFQREASLQMRAYAQQRSLFDYIK
jgi:flagellar hook-associated protein 3 FlgL